MISSKKKLHDAHVHIHDEALVLKMKQEEISCIANAASLEEYAFLKDMHRIYDGIHISAGIHPWNVEKQRYEQMEPMLQDASFIGEIGMDNVWCECALEKQEEVFKRQLQYAMDAKKPVILHTKGMEKEILACIKDYPNTYLVHWYSCNQYLEDYIKLGCWFTIGVSFMQDEAVKQVALKAPLDHILLESDGLDAIAWAMGNTIGVQDYPKVLETSLINLGKLRGMHPDEFIETLDKNYKTFIKLGENR